MFYNKVNSDLVDKIGHKAINLISDEAQKAGLNDEQTIALHMNFVAMYLTTLIETCIVPEHQDDFLGLLQKYVKKQIINLRTEQN